VRNREGVAHWNRGKWEFLAVSEAPASVLAWLRASPTRIGADRLRRPASGDGGRWTILPEDDDFVLSTSKAVWIVSHNGRAVRLDKEKLPEWLR
jgi:hypothetical protein